MKFKPYDKIPCGKRWKMNLQKRPSPYFTRVFCPGDGLVKTAGCAEGELLLEGQGIVALMCGDPLSRYTCHATCIAADFLRILRFFRCSSSIALHPPEKALLHLSPLNCQSVARQAASDKVSRYRGVQQLYLRVPATLCN